MNNLFKYLCITLTSFIFFGFNAFAGSWKIETSTGEYGTRNYRVYIPSSLNSKQRPALVVMLHGCDQSAADFATGTHIAEWAEKEKFIALFPEQNILYNGYKCWNWYLPINNTRYGESLAVVKMIDTVSENYNVDTEKVFVGGMSAGASMVSILGNCFPEKFKALASHDGTQYYATATGLDFATVVLSGASVTPQIAAQTGYACSAMLGANRPSLMPIIIFHGMNSPLMSPVHAFQIEDEMKGFNDFLDNGVRDNSYFKSKQTINVPASKTYGYNLYTTTNQDNQVFIERYMIDNLAHDWSGGAAGLKYNDPLGPDATALMINFFKRFGL